VIAGKFVDLYARDSGLRDKLIAERDVVLTYALRALVDAGVMDHLAFKGGTCLRKLVFGSSGRFSEDLDFTLDSDRPDDDVLTALVELFNGEHHGITFTFNEYYLDYATWHFESLVTRDCTERYGKRAGSDRGVVPPFDGRAWFRFPPRVAILEVLSLIQVDETVWGPTLCWVVFAVGFGLSES